MGRRDPDPRPPVELWGAEAGATEGPTRIQVGGRRPKRTVLIAAAVVVAVLAGGLALGSDDEGAGTVAPREERDNRQREPDPPVGRATTTTRGFPSTSSTTTTLLAGPVLSKPTGAALLLSRSSNRWTWLDLDTGLRREVVVDAPDPYSLVAVSRGIVILDGEQATYLPLPDGVPVALGDADQVLSSGGPDAVWLIRNTYDGELMTGSEAVLVDLHGTERSRLLSLPASYPVGGTDRGLVFSRGGRTYVADDRGVRPLALGDALRANRTSVVVMACNDQAVCAPEIVEVATGHSTRLDSIPNPYEVGITALLSESGDRLAVVTYGGTRPSLQIFDAAGRSLGVYEDLLLTNEPRWLPDDLGLVAAVDTGGVVRVYVGADGLVVEPITALNGVPRDFVYVIPR